MKHMSRISRAIVILLVTFMTQEAVSASPPDRNASPETMLTFWDRVIRLDPENAKAFNNRGMAHKNLGLYKRAVDDYTRAIRLDPDYADAFYNRGVAFKQLKEYVQACFSIPLSDETLAFISWLFNCSHVKNTKYGKDFAEITFEARLDFADKILGRVKGYNRKVKELIELR